jgi:hypothetical protein
MMNTTFQSLILISAVLVTSAIAQPPAEAAGRKARNAAADHPSRDVASAIESQHPEIRLEALSPSENPREVLLATVFHFGEYLYLDLKATGCAVEGLQRPFTPGSSNFLSFKVENFPDVVTEMANLAEASNCLVTAGSGDSIVVLCHGDRNAIIGVVSGMLRAAVSAMPVP